MKPYYSSSYLVILFLFFIFSNNIFSQQTIFHDNFGNSTIRTTSPYVPQSGADQYLSTQNFSHGSKFYKFAEIKSDYNGENLNTNTINDGYYAVINPANIHDDVPTGLPGWANFWHKTPASQPNSPSTDVGAVLVVNGGTVLNQFYRRAVELQAGKKYKLSAYVFSSNNSNIQIRFEVQATLSEKLLGNSNDMNFYSPWMGSNLWRKMEWIFQVPESISLCPNYPNDDKILLAIALRNRENANQGNDFYIDEIILEEVSDSEIASLLTLPGANNNTNELIECDDYLESHTIEAIDDIYNINELQSSNNTFLVSIIDNDLIDGFMPILSGPNQNAIVHPLGNWPSDIILNTDGTITITNPSIITDTVTLDYLLCNLSGLCSQASITINVNSKKFVITNPMIRAKIK